MAVTTKISLNADFLAQMDVTTPASTTGIYGDAAGVSDFVFRVAASKTGAALGSLSGTASERSADAGRYYKVFDKATIASALADYVGTVVYVILSRSGDLDGLYEPALVVSSEPAA